MMGDRVYILLDVEDGKAEQVAQVLQESLGVVWADAVDGPPDVIAIIEAVKREQLVELTVQALNSVGAMIELVRFLPARDKLDAGASRELSSRSKEKNRNSRKRGRQINKGE